MTLLAALLLVSFSGLSLLHLYWALGGSFGAAAAIPSQDGVPLFSPNPAVTGAVAAALAGIAIFAGVLGFAGNAISRVESYATFAAYALGAVLLLRAMGDFKYVGFFKRVRGTQFAVYDTWLFSPFCLVAGIAFCALAIGAA